MIPEISPTMSREASASETAELARLLAAHRRAVVFTGAGMSTESGLPDFRSGPSKGPAPPAMSSAWQSHATLDANRSHGGLWKQSRRFEELASVDALDNAYDEHVEFYR